MIQRSGPLQPLAWPGLGNGPQLWHLRQNLEPFNTWNSTPILSLGIFLALSGHCIWSSMCPNGPSPSISWTIRNTSHHHLLSGCETQSLNSRFPNSSAHLGSSALTHREHFQWGTPAPGKDSSKLDPLPPSGAISLSHSSFLVDIILKWKSYLALQA